MIRRFLTTIILLSNKISNIFEGWYCHITEEYNTQLYKERRTVCNGCEYRNEKLDICRICLCPLKAKLKVEDEFCPLMRWSAKDIHNV